jgi:hypothetical protein
VTPVTPGGPVLFIVSYYLCSSEERTSQLQLNCVLLLGESGDDGDLKDQNGQGKASADSMD